MASLLSQYKEMCAKYNSQLNETSLPPASWIELQELIYRISVLEGFCAYIKTAPITTDRKIMGYHFQLVDMYIGFVGTERKYSPIRSDEADKKRQTADSMLTQVIQEGRRQFKSFAAKSDQHYKNCISKYIDSILCAWIQYRNTYININIKEA